jgi:uncharacterized damage-inducible protein DinB
MPQTTAGDRELLLSSLNAQREHVLETLDGLSEDDLRRTVLPSGWSCAGMVQHLAFDVERFWFVIIVAGEAEAPDIPKDAWQVPSGAPAGTALENYRREFERANEIICARSLEVAPDFWPEDRWPNWRFESLREVILHVMTETACHAGHLDAARELIDGHTYMVLTD